MIQKLVSFFLDGIGYIKAHPQFLPTLLLIVVIPLAFLFSSKQFLDAARSNQERLERDRIGLLHDSFLSIISISDANIEAMQQEIEVLSELNPDIELFHVAEKTKDGYVPIVALNSELIGVKTDQESVYDRAFVNPNESIVDEIEFEGKRYIRGVRLASLDSHDYVIFTITSREAVDELFASREQKAYIWLVVLLIVILALLIRHLRLIDYSYLYRQTKKANEMKDLFTNMIAHELRAPLAAMRGYASLIREKDRLDNDTREQAARIEQSAERLVVIVSDLLDVARIQSGKLAIEKGKVEIGDVIRSVSAELEPSADEKGITILNEGLESPIDVFSDKKRLHQALTNLVSNAIKYTKEGSITLAVQDKKDRVELRVKDTGMGISAENQKELFAPFFRVQSDDVSQITGTGLGMWITKQLIELMGGSIAVESIKGVGTHVVVTLPKK